MLKRSRKSSLSKVVVEPLILEIRGQKVILDSDLAQIYGVTTKRLNEQVKRNRERFPVDFMFRLTGGEVSILREGTSLSKNATSNVQERKMREGMNLRSQFSTSSSGRKSTRLMRSQNATASKRNVRNPPYVFTEHGALMAANILNSPSAIQMSVLVVRAFVRMKRMMLSSDGLAQELASLKKELRGRLDVHESTINDILRRIMLILNPPPLPPGPPKREIGFHVRD